MGKFTVVKVTDSGWDAIISNAKNYDFYHTQTYHLLEQENHSVLFVYNFNNNFVALPLIIRSIPGSEFFDCTSVYGYCGPISNINFADIPAEEINQFQKELLAFFIERKIVSAFSRLHPLFPGQEMLFHNFGEVLTLNKTVAINLNQSLDVQWFNYRKSTRVHIRKALESGIVVRRTKALKDLDQFIDIYYENMQRISAKSHYYFSQNYFRKLINASTFSTELLVAEKEDEIIAGLMITVCNGIMQYHLDGTRNEMLIFSPMKLLFDSARIYANELSCNYCHLGGGYGGVDDSLFNFKTNFSKDFYDFKVWRNIINMNMYKKLVQKRFGNHIPSSHYFPLYRAGQTHSFAGKII